MMLWRFDEFVHGQDQKGICSDDMPKDAEAELDVLLSEHLGIRSHTEWPQKDYRSLGNGLGEIRFTCGKLEYRVYCSFAPGRVVRLWIYATKDRKRKGKQGTEPPNAIDTARYRKKNFELHDLGKLRTYVS